MATPETPLRRLAERADANRHGLPLVTVAVLALIAAILVGSVTAATVESPFTALGLGAASAVVLFVATLAVFEAGRTVGSDVN